MTSKIKRLLALGMSLTMMASVLAGCSKTDSSSSGTASTTSSETKQDITLTLWGSEDDQEMLKTMVENFKKEHTENNYTINLGVCGEDVAKDTVLKDLDAAADVFAFASDQTAALVSAGALMPVTIDTDKITSENTEASVQAATIDGQLYAYPSSADTYFLYYNKSMLSEDDVKSLESIMSKSLPDGVTHFAMNLSNGWYIASFFFASGCKLFGDDGMDPTKCDFNSANGVAAVNYMIDLVNQGSKFADYGTNFDSEIIEHFKEKKLASAVSGTWNASKIQEVLGDDYAATKLPTIKINGNDTQMGSFANFKCYGVNSHTKNAEAAMALAEYLTNKDNQKLRFEQRGFAPTNKELAADTETLSSNIAVAADANQTQYATLQPSISQMSNFWTPAQNLGTSIENKKTTKDTAQSDLDKMVQSILAEIKQ